MSPTAAILAASLFHELLGYHSVKVGSAYKEENRVQQEARLAVISTQIVEACEAHPIEHLTLTACVALASTTAKWESGLLAAIHEGTKKGPSGELCLFQLHHGVTNIPNPKWAITHEEWAAAPGLSPEATRRCADLGVRVLGWHVHRCWAKWHNPRIVGDAGEPGFLIRVERVFAEYHHPDTACYSTVLPMSLIRRESFRELLEKLKRPIGEDRIAEYQAVVARAQ